MFLVQIKMYISSVKCHRTDMLQQLMNLTESDWKVLQVQIICFLCINIFCRFGS